MNTVRASGCVRVRYATPEMKLLAWLCIAWRPPVSSTFTHISFSDQPRRSPNSKAPNSPRSGVISCAASTSSGLSLGLSIEVCTRFAEALFACPASALKCAARPPTRSACNARGTRMKGVGKSPTTSGMACRFYERVCYRRVTRGTRSRLLNSSVTFDRYKRCVVFILHLTRSEVSSPMSSRFNKSGVALAVATALSAASMGAAYGGGLSGHAPGNYVSGDFHNHTTCSDGTISMQKLVKKATDKQDTPWGLDWFVQAGHGGNGNRNCTLAEDATLATPAYPLVYGADGTTLLGPNTSWQNSNPANT